TSVEYLARRAKGHERGVVGVAIAPLQVLDPRQAGQMVGEAGEAVLARHRGFLGALALEELPDLTADRGQHLEQILVRLADLAAEELHHAQHLVAEQDGKAERAVEADLLRDTRPREVGGGGHVRDPCGLPAEPDASRETDARAEGQPATHLLERRHADRRLVPHRSAAERAALGVHLPQPSDLPPEMLAYRLEDARRAFVERARLGQGPRDRVLRREAT